MMKVREAAMILAVAVGLASCDRPLPVPKVAAAAGQAAGTGGSGGPVDGGATGGKVVTTEDQWRKVLTPEQFHVLREKGTEQAFTGAYWNSHARALYVCAGCGAVLFDSDDKFDSGTGWPSFTRPARPGAVELASDSSWGMDRTEVRCARCGGHLGHVFDDGPAPTGQRFCINSVSLKQIAK